MKSLRSIDNSYEKTAELSARSSRALFRGLNLLSALIAAALLYGGWRWQSFAGLKLLMEQSFLNYYLMVLLVLALIYAYTALHELTHGLLLGLLGGKRPFFSRLGMQISAGCDAYLPRGRWLLARLGPVVLWGAGLLALCAAVPSRWFWPLYFCAVANFSLSIDDIYLSTRVLREAKGSWYCDLGVVVQVYRKVGRP